MSDLNSIFGCFVSITEAYPDASQEIKDIASDQGELFCTYIWGKKGISDKLKTLEHACYGNDLNLALFQFYVNPLPIQVEALKEIEPYRKKEKSVGIPIIVNNENFFSQTEEGRWIFLKQSILQKMDLLAEVVKKKKLDTNMDLLKTDLQKLLNEVG